MEKNNMINREAYMKQIKPLIGTNIIKVLTGIRRSGKSVMLQLIIEELKKREINTENIIYIDLESRKYLNIKNNEDLLNLLYPIIENKTNKTYLFIDEIQNIQDWEIGIRSILTDLNVDIYITGSNSKLLSGDLTTHIAGRFFEIKIYPFSFKEILQYNKENNIKLSLNEAFNEYIKYGGMPQIYQTPPNLREQFLEGIYNTIMINDISERYKIKNIELFKRIILYIMENLGRTFSANSIQKYLNHEGRRISTDTLYNYLNYAIDACFLNKVRREDFKGKKLLKTNEKFFLTDHGFRGIYFNNSRDISQILENIIYIEMLRRGYKITIGKIQDKEIDFICRKNDDKLYIQVSAYLNDETVREREFGELLKIKDNYPKIVLSMDNIDYSFHGIKHYNIINFLK